MDQKRFDRLARSLGAATSRRDGLRAALGGLLGLGAAAAAPGADAGSKARGRNRGDGRPTTARRRGHECGPDAPCSTGFDCVKQGRKRRCACSTGVTCAGACCPTGQVCQNGACVVPATCVAPGEPCKGVGKPCCDGRTCSSGQGGEDDVACYVHKTGACQSTADCVYGTACIDGRCGFNVPPPAALGAPCDPTVGQQCTDPAAVCTTYNSPDAPSGAFCVLPLNATCTGDPECTCYTCDYPNPSAPSSSAQGRQARAGLDTRLACCGPEGYSCRSDRNCCLGTVCVNGTCQTEACDVCASGCPYTTIDAAVDDAAGKPAGSTVTIAPGTYVESVEAVRNLTFRRCGRSGSVTWRSTNCCPAIDAEGEAALTDLNLANINFEMNGDPAIEAYGHSGIDVLRTTVLNCTFRSWPEKPGVKVYEAMVLGQRSATTVIDSTFRQIESNKAGSAIRLLSYATTGSQSLTVRSCTFEDNIANTELGGSPYQGGIIEVRGTAEVVSQARITDSVFLRNRIVGAQTSMGAALNVYPYADVTIDGASAFEDNVSESGTGGAIAKFQDGTVSIASTVQIRDNAPQQCIQTADDGANWTPVPNCAY